MPASADWRGGTGPFFGDKTHFADKRLAEKMDLSPFPQPTPPTHSPSAASTDMSARVTILCGPARCGKTRRLLTRYREQLTRGSPGSALWLAPTWRAAAETRDRLLDGTLAGCFAPGVMTFSKFAQAVLHAAGVPVRPVTRLMKRELVRQILDRQTSAGRLKYFRSIAKTAGLADLIGEFIGELKRLEIWPEEFRRACDARGTTDKDVELLEIYDLYQQTLREHGLFDAEGAFWSAHDVLAKEEGRGEKGEGKQWPVASGQWPEIVAGGQWPVAGTDKSEGRNPQSPIPNPQSPVFNPQSPIPNPSPLFPLPSPLSPSLVIADGFTDFTRTQHEILVILAARAEAMFITLPLEDQRHRDDLFAKPLKTLAELRRRHPGTVVEPLPRPDDSLWPAMAHLERTLFCDPRGRGSGVGGKGSGVRGQGAGVRGQEEEGGKATNLPSPACGRGAGGEGGKTTAPDALTLTLSQRERGPSLSPIPNPLSPLPSPLSIEILAAARQLGEIEWIAAQIKRLLIDQHVRPGEIAVVFRSIEPVGELLDEVFSRFGIPTAIESGETLDRCGTIRAMTTLLRLDLDDWPFDRLLAVLGSSYFQPEWSEWSDARLAALERAIRKLQIPRGRQRLLDQLAEDGACHVVASGIVRRLARVFDAMPQRATLPDWAKAWQRLAHETGLTASPRPLGEGQGEGGQQNLPSPACGRGAGDEGGKTASPDALTLTLSQRERGPTNSDDRRAWGRLMEALAETNRLADWLEQRPPELDRRAAFDALLDIVNGDRLGHSGDESGVVRVLTAESVRSLRVPYLFLAGLSEKAFPPPDREDRLYSEAEYLRLIDADLPLVARAERTREEMLLFYEAITRATRRLYLSYPALDESAQPLLPSPFLTEVEQAFGPESPLPCTKQEDLSPIPGDQEPLCCDAQFRVKAMATALDGNVALLAGVMRGGWGRGAGDGGKQWPEIVASDQWSEIVASGQWSVARTDKSESRNPQSPIPNPQSLIPNPSSPSPLSPLPSPLAAGLELIHLRQDRERFGPAEGILQSDAAMCYLAAKFHPQHIFAATDLERYASCPFRFLMERVLAVEPVEELALEVDVLERGRIVHDILAAFHQAVNRRLGRPASPLELDPAEYEATLAEAMRSSLPPEPTNPVQAALREIDRRLVVEWLSHYREQLEKYDAEWRDFDVPMAAELFEVSFGRANAEPPSTDQPFEVLREGQAIRVSGRIDRIDTGTVAGTTALNVIDYKTGGSIAISADTIAAGTTLQLPLYAIAAMELLLADRDAIPWRAGYWYVRDAGFKPRQALRMYRNDDGRIELDPAWENIRAGLGDIVAGLVRSIRAGRFPVCSRDENCTGYCPFNTVCRINQIRSLEKTCQPTATD